MNLDRRLLGQLKAVRGWLALTVFAGALTGALVIAQARLLSEIVARVFLAGQSLDLLWNPLLVLLAIIGARAALVWASGITAFRIAARIKIDLRERLSHHLQDLGPAYVRVERTGELSNTVIEGVDAVETYYSQYLPQLVLAVLVPLTVLAFVLQVDLLSGLVLLLTGPLIPFFMILIGKTADALNRRQYKDLGFMSAHLLDVLQGLTTLKVFGRSREQTETIARVSQRFRDVTMSVLRVSFLSAFALEMIATISTAVIAVEVGLRLLYGQMQFEPAFFVLILAPDFYSPLRLLGSRFHAGMSGAAAGERIFEILQTPAECEERGATGEGQAQPTPQPPSVSFRDVHYAYDGTRSALNGTTFVVEAGKHVSLVGPSGGGKSTVIGLLLGFIQAQRGEIWIDGIPLQKTSAEAWRAQVAWVPQIPYLFNQSIAENIRLARPEASLEQVAAAAKLACADEFICAFPQGYDTLVGERGARLSAGQAQRVALARAFLRDAPLLILDEATSNLDAENEEMVRQGVERLLENRTALIVSHRLNTMRRADKIIVLGDGQVVETGTHESLMKECGEYYRMVKAGSADCEGQGARGEGRGAKDDGRRGGNGKKDEPECGGEERFAHDGYLAAEPHDSALLTFVRLVRLAAPFKWWIGLAVLLGSLTIGSSIGLMAASAYIIACAALHPSIADLAVPIVCVRFFGISRGVFRYLERCVSHYVNFSLLARLRVWFYSAVEPLAPARLMQSRISSGDLLNRIVGDIETLQNFYVRVLAPPLVALVIAGAAFVFLSAFSAQLALFVLGFMVLVGIVLPFAARQLSAETSRRLIERRAELTTNIVDGIQGMADLIAFGRGADQERRVGAISRELVGLQGRMASIAAGHDAAGGLLTNAAMWATLVISIPLVASARLDGVFLPVLVLAVLASFEAVLALPGAIQYVDSNLLSARRLFEIAGTESSGRRNALQIAQATQKQMLPQTERVCKPSVAKKEFASAGSPARRAAGGCIRADDLSFRYTPGELLALDHVSFDLPAGKSLAIVGPSGAGKSTLLNLLMRFWDVAPGCLFIDGKDIMDYPSDEARALFAVVPQPTHLFNATVRENLALGRPEAAEEEIVDAAVRAQVHGFVAGLPQGYKTILGEHGLRLSGGERQRLAVARALVKRAPILLLDEPTANLDPLTEREVLCAIRAQMTRQTVLLITHRLVGLEAFDEIIVLRGGRIVERGAHESLMRANGAYRRMWELLHQAELTAW